MKYILIQAEGVEVVYMYMNTYIFPRLIHIANGVPDQWYWAGNPPEPISQQERQVLDDALNSKVQIITLRRGNTIERFHVIKRDKLIINQ